jgi:4-hydroxy-3-polyprenylbenzoate decarboxylase
MDIIVGVTGASGSCYGKRLLEVLAASGHRCHLIVTAAAEAVIGHELGEQAAKWPALLSEVGAVTFWKNSDLFAPFCSGSNPADAMAIVPCSMGTLSRIASGSAESLLTRSADVCLKERIPLILVVRETPVSLIHLENMTRVARAGGVILPASPGFYHRPETLGDIVDHVVGKILDNLGISHNLFSKWGSE